MFLVGQAEEPGRWCYPQIAFCKTKAKLFGLSGTRLVWLCSFYILPAGYRITWKHPFPPNPTNQQKPCSELKDWCFSSSFPSIQTSTSVSMLPSFEQGSELRGKWKTSTLSPESVCKSFHFFFFFFGNLVASHLPSSQRITSNISEQFNVFPHDRKLNYLQNRRFLHKFQFSSIILLENFLVLMVKVKSRKCVFYFFFLQQYFNQIRSRRVLSRPGIIENKEQLKSEFNSILRSFFQKYFCIMSQKCPGKFCHFCFPSQNETKRSKQSYKKARSQTRFPVSYVFTLMRLTYSIQIFSFLN